MVAEKSKVRCAEQVWAHPYIGRPCSYRARFYVRIPPDADWTPVCRIHLNVSRWANYADLETREIA